jgi:hypothetical protein
MKFIDLFNKNKDCADYKYRVGKFKLYSYLAKRNPGEFKIVWYDIGNYFRYCQKFSGGGWIKLEDSSGPHKTMGSYK